MRAAGDAAAADVDAFLHIRHYPLRTALRVSITQATKSTHPPIHPPTTTVRTGSGYSI